VPLCRSHLQANKLCKRQALRCRLRRPSRPLPLPQAPHSDFRCIACVQSRRRHTRGGFDRDQPRFPMQSAATRAKMSSMRHRPGNLKRWHPRLALAKRSS